MCLCSAELSLSVCQVAAKFVDAAVEVVDCAHAVKRSVFCHVTAFFAEVDLQTTGHREDWVKTCLPCDVVDIVGCTCQTGVYIEVYTLAAAETELKTEVCVYNTLMFHNLAVVVKNVAGNRVVPSVRSTNTEVRDDAEHAMVVHAAKAVEHIPSDFQVEVGIFPFVPLVAVFPMHCATLSAETESEVWREPMSYTCLIKSGGLLHLEVACISVFLENWHLCTGTELDVPIVTPRMSVDVFCRRNVCVVIVGLLCVDGRSHSQCCGCQN